MWFSGRTSAFQADGAGSIPATRSIYMRFRSCSSGVEHSLGKGEVASSILAKSSIFKKLQNLTVLGFFVIGGFNGLNEARTC